MNGAHELGIPELSLGDADVADLFARIESYRRLADVFHDVLSEQSLDSLLDGLADTLADLIPYDTLTVYEAHEAAGVLVPVIVRDRWADEIMRDRPLFGQGITGWAVEAREPVLANRAHLDPRCAHVPGTPIEPENLICIPLVARDAIKGCLNIYRQGDDNLFTKDEFELAKRFGDAAALSIDNAQIRASLEHEAQTDSLTGLYNHRFFQERLRAELNRAGRTQDSVALLAVDIDDFKRVNDVFGHGVGDQVLITLATLLRNMLRESDIVCRVGGEEFALILPSCDAADALGLADRIIEMVGVTEFEAVGRVTISVGIAHGPHHASNARELIGCADQAMLTAKSRGKNQVVLFAQEGDRALDGSSVGPRDGRSMAHLKMLQSIAGKLNRLNEVRQIGMTIANELRTLVDYHNCRVYLREGDLLVPIAFRGDLEAYGGSTPEIIPCSVGEGVAGHVAEVGQSLLVPNALECEFAVHLPGTAEIEESMIAVPLCYGTRTIGVIVLSQLGIDQFDDDDVRLMEVLAGQASVALENARLYEAQKREAQKAKKNAEIANALLDFGRALATAEGLDQVLARIVEQSARTVGGLQSSIWLQRQGSRSLELAAHWGYDERQSAELADLRIDRDAIEPMLNPGGPLILEPSELARLSGRDDLVRDAAWWFAPLTLDGDRLGFVVVALPSWLNEEGDRRSRLLMGMAHAAKLGIANATSYEDLEETFYSTVEALANALEAKDQYTSSHARSITDMALAVGRRMGMGPRELKRLELGALFHDIGKIGIPSAILMKPGPLNDEEREVIKTHPELGERIIAPIARLRDVANIVRHCHEHFDGSGYPDGVVGDAIPIEARIILVVDAFDAMTTDRPYRARLSSEEAMRRLRSSAGTQFDPDVVETFLALIESRPAIPV